MVGPGRQPHWGNTATHNETPHPPVPQAAPAAQQNDPAPAATVPPPALQTQLRNPPPQQRGVWSGATTTTDDGGVVPHPALLSTPNTLTGLECADLPEEVFGPATEELNILDFEGEPIHQHVEISTPFYGNSTTRSLEDFPAVKHLIQECHKILRHDPPTWEAINVICRRYSKGGQLRPHLDKVKQFRENIYSIVLQTTTEQGLWMYPPSFSADEHPFALPERAGRVFAMAEQSRYEWRHGVPPLQSGSRLSVSWRFFTEDFLPQQEVRPKPPKIPRLGLGNSAANKILLFSFCDGIGAVPWTANQIWPGKVLLSHGKSWNMLLEWLQPGCPTTSIWAIYWTSLSRPS